MACFGTVAATIATAFRSPAWATGPTGIRPTRSRNARSTSGLISRFGILDPTDGGKANRQSVAAEFQRSTGPSSLRATGFVLRNSLNLFSNFTYFLDDPEHGDQFEQAERRMAAGGRVTYRRLGHFFDRHTESAVGVQVRRDWLDPVGLYHTRGRAAALDDSRRRSRSDDGRRLRAERDRMDARRCARRSGCAPTSISSRSTSDNPLNSGDGTDGLVSPKLGAVFGPWAGTELYVERRHGLPQQRRPGRRDSRGSSRPASRPIA